jgi:peptidyl-prolyl cis-trans isomerase A (cyclophilin A)
MSVRLAQRFAAGLTLAALTTFSPLTLAADPRVEMTTNQGKVVIEVYPEKAPKTVENFLKYAKEGFYEKTIFHRVIDGFMIQGGGFDEKMTQKPTRAPVVNEAQAALKAGLKNEIGTVAMARTADPDSATAQFFINVANNGPLNYPAHDGYGYTVFGKVVEGMETVNKIAKVATGNRGFHQNVPLAPVVIESVKVIEAKPAKK